MDLVEFGRFSSDSGCFYNCFLSVCSLRSAASPETVSPPFTGNICYYSRGLYSSIISMIYGIRFYIGKRVVFEIKYCKISLKEFSM